jgi:hypothetical protein
LMEYLSSTSRYPPSHPFTRNAVSEQQLDELFATNSTLRPTPVRCLMKPLHTRLSETRAMLQAAQGEPRMHPWTLADDMVADLLLGIHESDQDRAALHAMAMDGLMQMLDGVLHEISGPETSFFIVEVVMRAQFIYAHLTDRQNSSLWGPEDDHREESDADEEEDEQHLRAVILFMLDPGEVHH